MVSLDYFPLNYENSQTVTDGYTNAVNNRTVFPLTGGVVQLNSEHPKWTGMLHARCMIVQYALISM